MAEEKRKGPRHIGLISLAGAFVVYTLVFSLLTGQFVTPFEGKGFGLLVILFLYVVFRVVLTFAVWLWVRTPVRKS
jgi:hypothetical protein